MIVANAAAFLALLISVSAGPGDIAGHLGRRDGVARKRCPVARSFDSTNKSPDTLAAIGVEKKHDANTQPAATTTTTAVGTTTTAAETTTAAATTTTAEEVVEQLTTTVATTQPTTTTTTTTTVATTTTTTTRPATTTSPANNGGGLIGYNSSNCGPSYADSNSPNGAISWLNCGISRDNPSSGWNPPNGVTISRLRTANIYDGTSQSSVWAPCRPYFDIFTQAGKTYNIPPILLASFALQESSCRPSVKGQGGEMGMMQITHDKCGGRSDSECLDPWFNVHTAAAYFRKVLDSVNDNVVIAIGQYNGWYPGLSFNKATAARYSGCCRCQNNLDYLDQMLNGWVLGKEGNKRKTYNNLAVCG